MAEEWVPPDKYHGIWMGRIHIVVDGDTRKEVESWLRDTGHDGDPPAPTLEIIDLYGEEVTLVRGAPYLLSSSSPEGRARDRIHDTALEAERGVV